MNSLGPQAGKSLIEPLLDLAERRGVETALRESEERFRATFEQAAVGIAHVGTDNRYLLVNRRLCDMLGYTREELLTKTFEDITHPDDLVSDLEYDRRLRSGAIHSSAREKRYVCKDGSILWINLTVSMVRDHSGAPSYFIAVIKDISDRKRAEEALLRQQESLRESEERFRLLFYSNPQPMWVYDVQSLRFLEVNDAAVAHYGFSREEFLQMRICDIRPETDRRRLLDDVARSRDRLSHSGVWRHQLKDGRVIDVEITSHTLAFKGRHAALVLAHDMTKRKRAEEALRESEERLARVFETVAEGITVHDLDGRIRFANPAAERLLGLKRSMDGAPTAERPWHFTTFDGTPLTDDERPAIRSIRTGTPMSGVELVLVREDGARIPISINTAPLHDAEGAVVGTVTSFRDITQVKTLEQQLRHQALHDSLTGLPNRALLLDRLEHAILSARRTGAPLALLLMDLDRFKEVNDTFGHHYGDLLLQHIRPRLRDVLRATDTVARLGGDEFAVLLPNTDEPGASRVSEKILATLSQPFEIGEQSVHVEPSIGIALYPEHGQDANTLMRRADVSMYVAKRSHSGYSQYRPEHDLHSPARLALITGLRHATEHDEMILHYQPKVSFATGSLAGMEALVRWQHPQYGLIPPSQFIPEAEQTGLIKQLSFWVVKEALNQCRAWYEAGHQTAIAVNLSTRSLHDPQFADDVTRLIRSCAVSPSWLKMEITESVIMENPDRVLRVLTRLHDLGVRIGIDDFGTGYSSLAYLKRLPVDEIKIDRSFVQDMTSNESDAVIVRSVIDLGHNLGLCVVAEGVENRETWDMLAAMGCDVAQGFYLSRPLPPDELDIWLERSPGHSRFSPLHLRARSAS